MNVGVGTNSLTLIPAIKQQESEIADADEASE